MRTNVAWQRFPLAETQHERACGALALGELRAALAHVTRAIEVDAQARYVITRGCIEFALDERERALRSFTEAIERAADEDAIGQGGPRCVLGLERARAEYARAVVRWHQGALREALSELQAMQVGTALRANRVARGEREARGRSAARQTRTGDRAIDRAHRVRMAGRFAGGERRKLRGTFRCEAVPRRQQLIEASDSRRRDTFAASTRSRGRAARLPSGRPKRSWDA